MKESQRANDSQCIKESQCFSVGDGGLKIDNGLKYTKLFFVYSVYTDSCVFVYSLYTDYGLFALPPWGWVISLPCLTSGFGRGVAGILFYFESFTCPGCHWSLVRGVNKI